MNKWIRWILGFIRSGSFDYELPFSNLVPRVLSFVFVNLHIYSALFCILCFEKRKGMTTKKPEEATYFMAGNSSRILEKIQIHFEINFVSLKDSI